MVSLIEHTIRLFESENTPVRNRALRVRVANAAGVLRACLEQLVDEGQEVAWPAEYDEVADWLADNHGRGLLCIGNLGRGKSLICCHALPIILRSFMPGGLGHGYLLTCVQATQLNRDIDGYAANPLLSIDDIGTESEAVNYGQRRWALPEIVDTAEQRGHLLVLSSNLTPDELRRRYGSRTLDRLRHITRVVTFSGESFRGKK